MNNNTREIELKFKTDVDYALVVDALKSYPAFAKIYGESVDYYWDLQSLDADFVRLRQDGNRSELTIKKKDKGSNFNRMERNLKIKSPIQESLAVFEAVHGPFDAVIAKQYMVLVQTDTDLVVSAYEVQGKPGTIIEIESSNELEVLSQAAKVRDFLTDRGISVGEEPRSIYEMYVKGDHDAEIDYDNGPISTISSFFSGL